MAREFKLRESVLVEDQKQWKNMEVVKQEDQRFLKHKGKFYGYCHSCHKFGHKAADYRTKGKDQILSWKQDTKIEDDKGQVIRIPHGKIWRKNLDYENSEETQISNISEVYKDDDQHNNAINKNEIHYEGKQDGDVKEYTDEDKDEGNEEGYSDDCGILFKDPS